MKHCKPFYSTENLNMCLLTCLLSSISLCFPSSPRAGCLQDLPNLRKPKNALLLKVALESLSFGIGALQNEKMLFHQATKNNYWATNYFCQVVTFFYQATKFFCSSTKNFCRSTNFFVTQQDFFVAQLKKFCNMTKKLFPFYKAPFPKLRLSKATFISKAF